MTLAVVERRTIKNNSYSIIENMKDEAEKLCKEVRSILSPQHFDHCTTESFREIVRTCISSTCQLSAVASSCFSTATSTFTSDEFCQQRQQIPRQQVIQNYDDSVFHDVLFYSREKISAVGKYRHKSFGINWVELCKSHDASKRKENISPDDAKKHVSALEIVLETLVDQFVIPSCVASTLVQGLFSVCVEVYSSFSTSMGNIRVRPKTNRPSSLKVIEYAMQYIIRRSPSAMVSKSMETYVHVQIMGGLTIQNPSSNARAIIQDFISNYQTVRSQTLLSIASDLVSMKVSKDARGNKIKIVHRLQRCVIVKPVLSLLREIDAMDIFLLETNKRKSIRSRQICAKCRHKLGTISVRKTKRIKTTDIRDLHGEQSDDERASSFGRRFSHERPNEAPTVLPWKRVMGATGDVDYYPSISCFVCLKQNGKKAPMDITALPLRIIEFRASLYQILVDTLTTQSVEHRDGLRIISHSVFRMAVRYNMSASTRLCAVYAAYAAGIEDGFMEYILFLRKTINATMLEKSTMRTSVACISIYRELLKECAVFDDPVSCWRGLEPLFEMTLSLHEKATTETCYAYTATPSLTRELLKTIGLLLVTRSTVIRSNKAYTKIQLSFNSYILRFSEAFGDRNDWLDTRMTFIEQSQIIAVLQKLGILSFFDESGELEERDEMKEGSWLYNEKHSIRAAHLRMGPRVLQDLQIFSNPYHLEASPEISTKRHRNRSRDDSLCEEPIMDYINDDITLVIFSYLGYKLLARATSVCKSWRDIGNNNFLWKDHYLRRFKPIFLESLLPDSIKDTMKVLFVAKHCQRENIHWRRVFNQSKEKEKYLKFKLSSSGFRRRCCRVIGCKVVMKKREDETNHMIVVHHKDVAKKLGVLERAEARRLSKLEKEKFQRKKVGTEKQSKH